MTAPFDSDRDRTDAPRVGGRRTPKDAATLILTRVRHGGAEVLMGRRAPGHVFMAAKWVFPGGRIDRSDFSAAAANDLPAADMARLVREAPTRRARARTNHRPTRRPRDKTSAAPVKASETAAATALAL